MNLIISIVGFGNIGKYISGLLLSHIDYSFQINIMDIDWRVYGGILDLEHAKEILPNHQIAYNSHDLFNNSDFIFHCAGASVPPGKSRLITCQASIEITEAVFRNFNPIKVPKIIIVANPVEIITHVTQKITGLPKSNVIGTGTFLDSIRMNHIVKKTNSNISEVNAVLLGEHGTTAFLSSQLSTVNGQPFSSHFTKDTVEELMNSVKASAEEIKETQKATIYGISFCAKRIFECLLGEDVANFAVSTSMPEELVSQLGNSDIFLSLYCNINKEGAKPVDYYFPDDKELELFKKSVDLIKPSIPKQYL